jgi:hypothetical protein
MPTMTRSKAWGRPYEKFAAFSFKRGLDVKTSPQTLATDRRHREALTLARHVVYPKSGGVSKRLDTATYNTTTLGASVAITGVYELKRSNGDRFIIGGTDDGRLVLFNSDGTTTDLATGLTTGRRWSFATYNDLAICVNGADAPRQTTGTVAGTTTLGGSPPSTASHVFTHGNRVFMVTVNSSTLSWCALNDEADWTAAGNAGSMVVARHDGGNLIAGISSVSEALLLKENNAYRLQGTNPSTFAVTNVVPARTSVGGISFQALVFANNDVWWGSRRGVHSVHTVQEFGDLQERFPSEQIDPYFTTNTDYTVSLNQLSVMVMGYDTQHNRLYVAVDTTNNAQNDTLFVLDVFNQAWSVWPSMSCAALGMAYNGVNGDEMFMGGYDGFLRRLNVSATTNAIDARFNHITDLGLPFWVKRLRQLYVYLSEQGNQNLTVTTNYDFGATGGQSYSVSMLGASNTLGVNWTLGTDALGARSQIIKRQSVSGQGEFVEIGFANGNAGQPFTVYGYEALYRRHRTVGRGA